MSKTLIGSSLGLLAIALVVSPAQAQRHRRVVHHKATSHVTVPSAENALLGIHLFDSSEHVIGVYGSPDEIQPLTFGTQQGGGFGGGGGGFGGGPGGAGAPGGFPGAGRMGPGGPGGPRMGGGGGASRGGVSGADIDTPSMGDVSDSQFDFGDSFLQRGMGPPSLPGGANGGGPGGPGGPGGRAGGRGFPGANGPGGFPGGGGPGGFPGGGGKGAGGASGGGASESVTYTRWIYNRSNNKFAFVVNRLGQVIQIEAIGLANPKVKTKRGIGFGSHFGTIVKAYHNPDGYDIGGDNILVKYLVKDKVAFRLTRIGDKQPHQVTGIVVSAGKG